MRLTAIVLAAGRSRRFGTENKLLADVGGEAVIVRTLASITAVFDDTIVVTGPDHAGIAQVLSASAVRVVRCAGDQDGLGFSIAAGVRELAADCNGALILPGDMPIVTTRTLFEVVDAFAAHDGRRIVHAVDRAGNQRNPVLWPRDAFAKLAALEGERGGKALISNAVTVLVRDDAELIDIDDHAALERVREIVRQRHPVV